jgi:hypothetical protein
MFQLLNKPKHDINLTGLGSGTKLSFCFGDAEPRLVSCSKLRYSYSLGILVLPVSPAAGFG